MTWYLLYTLTSLHTLCFGILVVVFCYIGCSIRVTFYCICIAITPYDCAGGIQLYTLGFTAGAFLNISLVSVLPQLLQEERPAYSAAQIVTLLLGTYTMASVACWVVYTVLSYTHINRHCRIVIHICRWNLIVILIK